MPVTKSSKNTLPGDCIAKEPIPKGLRLKRTDAPVTSKDWELILNTLNPNRYQFGLLGLLDKMKKNGGTIRPDYQEGLLLQHINAELRRNRLLFGIRKVLGYKGQVPNPVVMVRLRLP